MENTIITKSEISYESASHILHLPQYNVDLKKSMSPKQAFNKCFYFGKLAFILPLFLKFNIYNICTYN
jgi:hypothetical protein